MTTTAITYPPRPTRSDAGVLKDAAELAYQALVDAHALEDAGDDESRKEDELQSLAKALGYGSGDGYRVARELDDDGWEVGAETVEILNQDFVSDALVDAERLWVKAYGGPALPPIGARVAVTKGSWSLDAGTELVVVKHYADRATIVANETGEGEGGFVLAVERVQVLTQDGAA